MKNKKIKLILLITITLLSTLFYNFLSNYKYEIIKKQIKPLIESNEEFITIGKNQTYFSNEMTDNYQLLTEAEIKTINQKLKKHKLKGYKTYKIVNQYADTDSIFISSDHNLFDYLGLINYINISSPYNGVNGVFSIVNVSDKRYFLKHYDVIGKLAEKDNEIMISNYVANLIINSGIKDYEDNDYYPENYNDIINYNGYFKFGNSYKVKIVGIVNYDLQKFELIKNIDWTTYQDNYNLYYETYENLVNKASDIYMKIFVNDSFIKNAKIESVIEPWKSRLENVEITVPITTEKDYIKLYSEFKDGIIIKNSYNDNFSNDKIDLSTITIISKIMLYAIIVLFILSIYSCISFFTNFIKLNNN